MFAVSDAHPLFFPHPEAVADPFELQPIIPEFQTGSRTFEDVTTQVSGVFTEAISSVNASLEKSATYIPPNESKQEKEPARPLKRGREKSSESPQEKAKVGRKRNPGVTSNPEKKKKNSREAGRKHRETVAERNAKLQQDVESLSNELRILQEHAASLRRENQALLDEVMMRRKFLQIALNQAYPPTSDKNAEETNLQ